jgi:hypothetical protein
MPRSASAAASCRLVQVRSCSRSSVSSSETSAAPPEVGRRPGAAGEQRGDPAVEEVLQDGAEGGGAVAQMGGDMGRRPGDRGERHHLQAIAGAGRQFQAAERMELVAGGFVELDENHISLYGHAQVKANRGQVVRPTR